jgi:hypothetical protein
MTNSEPAQNVPQRVVVISDNVSRARLKYVGPQYAFVGSTAGVLQLAKGAQIIIERFGIGRPADDPLGAAAVLLRRGDLIEAELPERPLE